MIVPVRGGAGPTEICRRVDAPVVSGVKGAAVEGKRVEVRVHHSAGVGLTDIDEAGAAITRGQHGDPSEHGVGGVCRVDRDRVVVPSLLAGPEVVLQGGVVPRRDGGPAGAAIGAFDDFLKLAECERR